MNDIGKQVGLNTYLALIAMLFVSGLIIFAMILIGANMQTNPLLYSSSGTTIVGQELHLNEINTSNYFDLNVATLYNVVCTITEINNATDETHVIGAGNYTQSNCRITQVGTEFNNTGWNVSYTYLYDVGNTAYQVTNATQLSVQDATDWFPTFIVIGAVIVLILLIVLIIGALRGSGLMGNGSA